MLLWFFVFFCRKPFSNILSSILRFTMDKLCQGDFDLNDYPFKLRFSPTSKIYKDILNISSEIYRSFHKLNREIQDKNEIKSIIRANFALIESVLRKIVAYYDSDSCTNVSEDEKCVKKKQMEEKLLCYYEDEQEFNCFERIKSTTVNVSSIPSNWKCLTWKNFSTSKVGNDQQCNSSDRIKQMISADGLNDNLEKFANDLEEICSSIRTLNHQIQLMKSKLNLLNEYIIRLYLNFKENLKVLVKFNRQFSAEDVENDFSLQNIKNDVGKIFEIELKLDFFSSSPYAYQLKVNSKESIRILLKSVEAALSTSKTINNNQISSTASNTDAKNLSMVSNYVGEVFIDPNIQ